MGMHCGKRHDWRATCYGNGQASFGGGPLEKGSNVPRWRPILPHAGFVGEGAETYPSQEGMTRCALTHSLVTATVLELGEDDEPYRQVSRPFFLDTGGFDGRQARNRRQTDRLKRHIEDLTKKRDVLPKANPRREQYNARIAAYEAEKQRCWRKYAARNRELAHLAANVLILLATVFHCELIAGESLKTLKSVGRGRGKKGRWQKWRNNTTIRGELWRVLYYKCFLFGIRLVSQKPEHTSHTCPRCHEPANTYAAPDRLDTALDSGHWLYCSACHYHVDRDYAASVNIARLGMAFLRYTQRTTNSRRFSMTDQSVKPASYTGAGATLLVPPPIRQDSPPDTAGRICITGWPASVWLSTSYNRASIFVVSQAKTRKSLLRLLER
jgi:putative transposase